MDAIDRMQIFARVAELSSFTQAADTLGLPKASVSTAVAQLEASLGTRLLHRTTRRVQLTQDGQAFVERCNDMLADMEDLQGMFRQQDAQDLRGRVRVDMSTGLARNIVIPRLPELLARHPMLEIEFSSTERRVDLVREGFDCVLRAGTVGSADLIARPVSRMRMVNCASPAYLKRFGRPKKLEDLAAHQLVHFAGTLGARPTGFDYMDGQTPASIQMAGAVTVNNADAYTAACLAGLGIIQAPATGVQDLLKQKLLVEVLPAWRPEPMPVTLVYANRRNLARRVRVVMDWLVEVVRDELARKGLAVGEE